MTYKIHWRDKDGKIACGNMIAKRFSKTNITCQSCAYIRHRTKSEERARLSDLSRVEDGIIQPTAPGRRLPPSAERENKRRSDALRLLPGMIEYGE